MQEQQQTNNPGAFNKLLNDFINSPDSSEQMLSVILESLLPCSIQKTPGSMPQTPLPTLNNSEQAFPRQEATIDIFSSILESQTTVSPNSVVCNTPPTISLSNSPIPPPTHHMFYTYKQMNQKETRICKQQKMFRKYKGSEKWKEEMFERMIAMQTQQQQSESNNMNISVPNQ